MWGYNDYPDLNYPIPPLLSFDKKAMDEHLKKIEERIDYLNNLEIKYEK